MSSLLESIMLYGIITEFMVVFGFKIQNLVPEITAGELLRGTPSFIAYMFYNSLK